MQTTSVRTLFISLLTSTSAFAQIEPDTSSLSFQVWDGTTWQSKATVTPGARVEYRAVVSYTGSSTSPVALGSIRYQPTFSDIDNSGPSMDTNAPFRNAGVSGDEITASMLSAAEGQSGAALPTYGRVTFGGIAMQSETLNVLSQFRHGGDFSGNKAPAGSWLRLAGSEVVRWPLATLESGDATPDNLNNISNGVVAGQASLMNPTGSINTFYVAGRTNLVIFRGALLLSDQQGERSITISSAAGSQDRVGDFDSSDDARFMTWFTNDFGGSFRSSVSIKDASIIVIPSPATAAPLLAALLFSSRNRRNAKSFGHR